MAIACEVSRHERPAMEPESSSRITVSKVARNAYLSSAPDELAFAAGVAVGRFTNDGAETSTGDGEYAGGGSFDGTVNAFMPGLSGRLVAGDGFESGFGLGDLDLDAAGFAGTGSEEAPWFPVSTVLVDFVDLVLFLRPNFRLIEPNIELRFDSDPSFHELVGIVGARTTECVIVLEVMKVQVEGVDIVCVTWCQM